MDDWISMEPDALPEELAGLVKPELQPGERLLWVSEGKPRSRAIPPVYSYPPVWPKLPHAVFACLALCTLGGALIASSYDAFGPWNRPADRTPLMTFGIVSILIGLFLLAGSIISWLSMRPRDGALPMSRYALTDRRAICWRPKSGTEAFEVYTLRRGTIKDVYRVEYPDGSGDVLFNFDPETSNWYVSGFEGVPEVRRVEDLVRRTLIDPVTGT